MADTDLQSGPVDTGTLSPAEFSRLFKHINQEKSKSRQYAKRTLTPGLMRSKQQWDLDVLRGGQRPGGFTLDELKKMKRTRDKLKREDGIDQGVEPMKLMALSTKDDFAAAKEIRAAKLYSVEGGTLLFQVTASPSSAYKHHQVRIRLESWRDEMLRSRAYTAAVKKAVKGKVSVDCSCGRHQYWYRYIATAGNYALSPEEHSFPKIRNPKLKGRLCKHLIKALAKLDSPTVHKALTQKMEVQARRIGFGGEQETALYFGKNQKDELDKARKDNTDKAGEIAKKAYKQYLKDQKVLKKQMDKPSQKKKAEMKVKAERQKKKALKAKSRFDSQIKGLKGAIELGTSVGMTKEAVIKKMAENNKWSAATVKKLTSKL